MEVKRVGGIGFILGNSKHNGDELVADAHVLPATAVNYENALKILDYINSTRGPKANIVPARTVLDAKPAPFMAAFSSRGPSTISPDILKVIINSLAIKAGPTRLASYCCVPGSGPDPSSGLGLALNRPGPKNRPSYHQDDRISLLTDVGMDLLNSRTSQGQG